MIEVTESRSEIVFEALPIDDPQVRQPDITRARELLGWEPTTGLREALRLTVERSGVERLVGAAMSRTAASVSHLLRIAHLTATFPPIRAGRATPAFGSRAARPSAATRSRSSRPRRPARLPIPGASSSTASRPCSRSATRR